MSNSSWVSNGTNVAYEPKEKNTGEVITSFATTSPGGVPNSSYAPSTYVLAASGAWIAPTVSSNNSEISRPSVYTELTGLPVPYFSATDTNLVYDADANHITTFGEFTLEGLNVLNDASFTYTSFAAKSQTWTASKLNISRNYPRTRWNTGTEARFYLSTDSGSTWTLILTDDYDSDPIAVTIFSHTLATVNPSSLSAYQVKVEIDAFPSSAFNSVGVLYLQLYDIWIEGIYAVSGGSGTVTSITTTGANGVTISGGSTQTITTSGIFALALGAITPTSIATGTGSFSGDVEFAASIKSPTNSPVTIAPDGTGDVHLNTDSVRIGDNNADATLHTRGTGDLIITTHEGSAVEGIVRLYDGANGNITLTPNGSGQVKVGTDQVVTLVASQTLTNKTISGSANTLSNIANASLTNSTISGVALGGTLGTLTLNTSGTGLSGSQTYNGSGAATFTVASNATNANTASTIVARDASGNFSAGTITANLTGNASGSSGSTTGNAATATALQTARAINGVNFDGTAAITVTAAAGTLTGATLASGVTASSLTSVGTLTGLTVSGTTSLATTSGNVGIGTTPSAWSAIVVAQFKGGFVGSQNSSYLYTGQNTYFNGTNFIYSTTAAVTMLEQSFGAFVFYRAASGTAGNTVSFSESCRIDSSGNLLIGVTSASYSSANRGVAILGGSASGLLGFQIGGVAKGYVAHFDSSMQIWNEVASPILFGTSATERVRIDSSGNLLVGRTTTPADGLARIAVLNTTDTAIQLTKSGVVSCRITAISTALAFGVDGSDGATERMRIDTTQVKATVPFIGNSGTKGFGGITTTTSTSTPTGGSSGDHYYIY